MKSKEEIEAIALEKYRIMYPVNDPTPIGNAMSKKARKAFIEGYEQAQNDLQQSHAELLALRDEVLKVWNEDGENGDIQMKTPIAWYRVLRIAEQTIENQTK